MSVDIDRENQINHLILINSFCRLLQSSHDIVFFADCIITFSFYIGIYKVLFQFPVMIPSTFIVQGGQITCLFHMEIGICQLNFYQKFQNIFGGEN